MALIVNITWFVKPEKRIQFIAELSGKLPVTKAYDGCRWLYLADNADAKEDRVEAVSMWDCREKYDAYLAFREESGELGEFAETYYTADPQWKYMTVLMDFNK